MSKLRTIATHGAVAGVSFAAGLTVGQAILNTARSDTEGQTATMNYPTDQVPNLVELIGSSREDLVQHGAIEEANKVTSFLERLREESMEAARNEESTVEVTVTAPELLATMRGILAGPFNNGTQRRDNNREEE